MLSISDEVISASEDILNTIKKRFWGDDFKKIGDGGILYTGEFQKQLWGYNITIYYSVYNFTYKETFEEDVKEIKGNNIRVHPKGFSHGPMARVCPNKLGNLRYPNKRVSHDLLF